MCGLRGSAREEPARVINQDARDRVLVNSVSLELRHKHLKKIGIPRLTLYSHASLSRQIERQNKVVTIPTIQHLQDKAHAYLVGLISKVAHAVVANKGTSTRYLGMHVDIIQAVNVPNQEATRVDAELTEKVQLR